MALFQYDGHTRRITDADLVRGHVLRWVMHETSETGSSVSSTPVFSDCVIMDVFYRGGQHPIQEKTGDKYIKLARPYCYVSGADTACPSVLTGVEHFEVRAERLCRYGDQYKLVVQSTGEPAKYTI